MFLSEAVRVPVEVRRGVVGCGANIAAREHGAVWQGQEREHLSAAPSDGHLDLCQRRRRRFWGNHLHSSGCAEVVRVV